MLRTADLRELGLDVNAQKRWVADARLHRRHQGVFSLGHRILRPRGQWMAAAWAVDGGVLSHLLAAAFHGWTTEDLDEQHVTTTGKATSRTGLEVHRVGELAEIDVLRGPLLSVTRQPRTIVDLAELLPYDELRRIVDRVRSPDVAAIRAAQARSRGKHGAPKVTRLLGRLDAHTRSEFERRYLRFCRRHGVPLPDVVNGDVAGFLVDCRYGTRVVVELDGRAWHARRDQMRRDRLRDRKLLRAGCVTVRLVWEDLDDESARATAADLLGILTSAV